MKPSSVPFLALCFGLLTGAVVSTSCGPSRPACTPSLFVEGVTSLNVVYALFLQLLEVCSDLAIEDRITGELHDRASLLRLVRRDEQKVSRKFTVAASLVAA